MAREFLKPIYEKIYEERFDATCFEKRMEMQKAIYLLQEAGIQVGDYDFLWYKHGPYCQSLQDDILVINDVQDVKIRYSEDAKDIIAKMRKVFNESVDYSRSNWVECLASLHYLQANVFPLNASEEEIVKDLEKKKPHLNNRELNLKAFDALNYILQ